MSENRRIRELLEQSDDQVLQRIIDEQEGLIGIVESKRLGSPSDDVLAKWSAKLDKLPGQRRGRRRLRRIVILAAIVTALLLAAVAGAYHTELLNWWERVLEEVNTFNVEEDPEALVKTWNGFYAPTDIPEDFEIARAVDGVASKIIEYHNAAGNRILYYQYTDDASFGLDMEDATPLHVLSDASAYEKEGETTYYWFVEDRAYVIIFDSDAVTLDAVERMAESLSLIT